MLLPLVSSGADSMAMGLLDCNGERVKIFSTSTFK
jgi:hypothetical protein